MLHRRAGPIVLIMALVGLLSTSMPSVAQTNAPAFPPGHWNGSVFFGGEYTTEGDSFKDVRTVNSSIIFFDLVVDQQGQVTEGTMTVEIEWSSVNSGTTPVNNDPYRIEGEHRDTASLDLEGNAEQLVATGTMTTESFVYDTDGNFLEGVSGPSDFEVGWVFQATEITCGMASGALINAWGTGIMLNAHHGGSRPVAIFRLLSSEEQEQIEWILSDMQNLDDQAAAILADPSPDVQALASLIIYAKNIQQMVAQLEQCKALPEGFLGSDGEGWMATILRKLIFKVLNHLEELSAADIIFLLNTAVWGDAASESGGPQEAIDLYEDLGDALEFALGRAVAADDTASITDIAAAAAQYGFTDLHDAATSALEGEG